MAAKHPNQKHLNQLEETYNFVSEHPELPIDYIGHRSISREYTYVAQDELAMVRAEYKAVAKALAKIGKVEKTFGPKWRGSDREEAGLELKVSDSLTYKWACPRDSVCSKQKVVKEVEEWVCEPVLAGAES